MKEKTVKGKLHKRVIGVETNVIVYKNSLDAPYREAPLYILFDYGIDDVRANLQYIKTMTKSTEYKVGHTSLGNSMDEAVSIVEQKGLEQELKDCTVQLWREIQKAFHTERKKKVRL